MCLLNGIQSRTKILTAKLLVAQYKMREINPTASSNTFTEKINNIFLIIIRV